MPMAKNTFKPWTILLGIIILVLVCLACFLPYWLSWDTGDVGNQGYSSNLGYWSWGTNNAASNYALNVNAGFWETEVTSKAAGTYNGCGLTSSSDGCVCPASDTIGTGSTNDLSANRAVPLCKNGDIKTCEGTRLSTASTAVSWYIKAKTDCDPHLLAYTLRCGARLNSTNNIIDNDNDVSSKCATGNLATINQCMRDWIRSGQGSYIASIILIVLACLIYLVMPCLAPTTLPTAAIVALILVFLNALAVTWGMISGVVAFRHGCENDWDALPGKTQWSYNLGISIVATVLAWAWLCWAIDIWKQAKLIRDWFLYDTQYYYGKPAPMYAPAPVYGAAPVAPAPYYGYEQPYPVDYVDPTYYSGYGPASQGYGPGYAAYGYGAEEGYGAEMPQEAAMDGAEYQMAQPVPFDGHAQPYEGYAPEYDQDEFVPAHEM